MKRSGSAQRPLLRLYNPENRIPCHLHGLPNPGVRLYPHLPFPLRALIPLPRPVRPYVPFSSFVELIGTHPSSDRKPQREDGSEPSQIPHGRPPGDRDLLDSCFVTNIALSRFADSLHIFKLQLLGQISKGFASFTNAHLIMCIPTLYRSSYSIPECRHTSYLLVRMPTEENH